MLSLSEEGLPAGLRRFSFASKPVSGDEAFAVTVGVADHPAPCCSAWFSYPVQLVNVALTLHVGLVVGKHFKSETKAEESEMRNSSLSQLLRSVRRIRDDQEMCRWVSPALGTDTALSC